MNFRSLFCVAIATSFLGACASFERHADSAAAAPACDVAVADGLSASRRQAIAFAEEGARQQYADSRGYLLGLGLRRIRIAGKTTRCRPHPLAQGLVHCTAEVRLCGR